MSDTSIKLLERTQAIDQIFKDKFVSMEFADMFIGELIGFGASRYVFECRMNKNRVVKIDMSDLNANVAEYDVWSRIQYTKIAKYFSPVRLMTACGRILLMDKANCEQTLDKYPKEIPSFFTDIKQKNFGFIKGQFVCVDYASNLLMEEGMKVKMKKAKWL